MILLCGLVILPILDYAQTVSRQNRVLQTKTTRIEAVNAEASRLKDVGMRGNSEEALSMIQDFSEKEF